ncbi:hypothetical protein GR204_01710 [Rhizobium leguminosarum]|uniref:Uncharacterized protein n=1 Tax=Rhizobium leguminosarum TaxID=384 RepID=A0A6P0AYT5_RHILE|nr:hypothetical protein [Rhizobium leguminosarum]NEI32730.1 hypothetical protein [Rhizobium leguminosarum]NEI39489.1 hypothetical protein [Rhizobium leguminosarum]
MSVTRYRSGRTDSWLKVKCYEGTDYEIAAVVREPGRPNVAYMVTPDKGRRHVGGAFIPLTRRGASGYGRVNAQVKPLKGVKLKPDMVGRVRHLKVELLLRHATLREIKEE